MSHSRSHTAPLRARLLAGTFASLLAAAACSGGPGAPTSGPGSPGSGSPGPSVPFGSAPGSPAAGTACSESPGGATTYPGWPSAETPAIVPIFASPELTVGENRVLFTLVDQQNEPVAAPDLPVEVAFYDLAADPERAAATADAVYMETTEDLPGLYRANVDFSCWGDWGVEITARATDGPEEEVRAIVSVAETGTTPALGAPVPASATPTAEAPAEIGRISTDEEPDPDFYRLSVAEALEAGRPFVVVFSTPAFCQTRACGPALELVKEVAGDFKDQVEFIHVEPYQLEVRDGGLQPVLGENNTLQTVASVAEWGLPSEPYIFVVDAEGRLAAKMAGVAGRDELETALREVTGSG